MPPDSLGAGDGTAPAPRNEVRCDLELGREPIGDKTGGGDSGCLGAGIAGGGSGLRKLMHSSFLERRDRTQFRQQAYVGGRHQRWHCG